MNYLEELYHGDSFIYKDNVFVLTADFRNNNKLCYNLKNGNPQWLDNQTIVDQCPIYRLDKDNNIIAIKETKNDKNINIS